MQWRVARQLVRLPDPNVSPPQSTNVNALRCVMMTPLGLPVDPDVYKRYAGSVSTAGAAPNEGDGCRSSQTTCGIHAAGLSERSVTIASSREPRSPLCSASDSRRSLLIKTAETLQLPRM